MDCRKRTRKGSRQSASKAVAGQKMVAGQKTCSKPGGHVTPWLWGIIGGLGLLAFYLLLLTIANSPAHAWQEFSRLWYWVLALAIGFGIQVGLYAYARERMKARAAGVAASGGMSAASMAACCAHHLSDVLPLIGLAGFASFLTAYQTVFIVVGVASNLFGVLIMLRIIRKHNLYEERGVLATLFANEMAMYVAFDFSIVVLLLFAIGRLGGLV